MRIAKKVLSSFQTNIVAAFVILLFLIFAMVGVIFHVAADGYIAGSAVQALSQAQSIFENTEQEYIPNVFIRALRGSHRFPHTDVKYFVVGAENTRDAAIVSQRLAEAHGLDFVTGMKLHAEGRTFFVSVAPLDEQEIVFYLDASDAYLFMRVVDRMLLSAVCLVFVFAMIFAGIMVDTAMKPLKILRNFVMQIGNGDFKTNSHKFASEQFNELNNCLNMTAYRLAEYDNEQKMFFQNVSHDLRSPLMSIKGNAEAIEKDIVDSKEAAATIIKAVDELKDMVDNILYVSRLDAITAPIMEETNLGMLLQVCVERAAAHAQKRGIELQCTAGYEPIILHCAAKYIARAIDNLLSNAIRFAETRVTVEYYNVGRNAVVRVIDDGPGFEPGEISHVFERFYKGKNGMTGIGLAIVKSIIDQHRGVAIAENGAKGAVLTVSVPRKRN
ncbi:MAG: HAMP domain-containing histidine kinase [Defluviitaleaceae bacterium]|nr:HAMP domain-containing histidine kinase [Defluviitaleaceae bacterium]